MLAPGAPCEEIAATLGWFVGAGERATAAIVDEAADGLRRAFRIHPNRKFQPGGASQARKFVVYTAAICRALANGTLSWEHVRRVFAQAQDDSRTGPDTCNSERLGAALLERVGTWG